MFDDSVLFLLRGEKQCSARACSKLAGAGNTLWIKDADSEVFTEKESKESRVRVSQVRTTD